MRKAMRRGILWGLVIVPVILLTAAVADVPLQFNYQGYLCETGGDPVLDGSYTVTFSIWDDSLGGTQLWSETHTTVTTEGGLFSVQIGSIDSMESDVIFPDTLGFVSENRYLQVEIGMGGPVQPRTRLVSTPYSIVTRRVLGDISTWPGRLELANLGYMGQYTMGFSTQDDLVKMAMESTDGYSSVTKQDELNVEMLRKVAKWLSASDSSKTETLVDMAGVLRKIMAASGSEQASAQQKVAGVDGVEVTRQASASTGDSGEKKETVKATSVRRTSTMRAAYGDSSKTETNVDGAGVSRMAMASAGAEQASAEQKVTGVAGIEMSRKAAASTGDSGEKKETVKATSVRRTTTMRAAYGDSSKTETSVDTAGVSRMAMASAGAEQASAEQKVAGLAGVEMTGTASASTGDSSEKKETVKATGVRRSSTMRAAFGDSSKTETSVDTAGVSRRAMASAGAEQASAEQKVTGVAGVEMSRKAAGSTGGSGEKKETVKPSGVSWFSAMRGASGDSSKTETNVDGAGVSRRAVASAGAEHSSAEQKVTGVAGVEMSRKASASTGDSGEKKETVKATSVRRSSTMRAAFGDSSKTETNVDGAGVSRMAMASVGSEQASAEQKVTGVAGVEMSRKASASAGDSSEKKETVKATSVLRSSTMRAASGDSSKTETNVDSAGVRTKAMAVQGARRSTSMTEAKAESVEQMISHKSSSTDSTLLAKRASEILAKMRCQKASAAASRMAEMVVDTIKALLTLARSDPDKTDSVAFNAGGAEPSGLRIFKTPVSSSVLESAIELYADYDGGKMAMPNPADTLGDGIKIETGLSENMIQVRKGGTGSEVYVEASSSGGGKIGVNTVTPSQALHVVGNICATGSIGACSDRRYKTDIQPLNGALEKIEQLRGIRFKWNPRTYPDRHLETGSQIGFVAQEVNEVLPELVTGTEESFYTVDYARLTPLLVEAIKELRAENESLKKRLDALENERTRRSSIGSY